MSVQDKYQNIAGSFNEYLKDFFEPPANHTTYHFGYKPVRDIVAKTPGFPNIALLDYGSGAGQFCAWLQGMGVTVTGLEISEAMLDTARKNFPTIADRFMHPDQMPPTAENSFDVCTMNFVTCEIPDRNQLQELFQTAHRFLKPQGKLVILTNNPEASPKGAEFVIWSTGPIDAQTLGSPFDVTIHNGETKFNLVDYFWAKEMVLEKLQITGFHQAEALEPSIEDMPVNAGWKDEIVTAPTLIYTAMKL